MSAPALWCVVPAGGRGSRMAAGGDAPPKQYLDLCGRTILEHSVRALLTAAPAAVIVVVAADDERWRPIADALADEAVEFVAAGGAERADSVRGGLGALAGRAAADDLVAVHDAARPCLGAEDFARVVAAAREHGDGALLARPVADTVKRAASGPHGEAVVAATEDRTYLWLAQTPQVFPFGLLSDALTATQADAASVATDEAMAVEHLGRHPVLVTGSARNLKVTRPEDLALAASHLRARPLS